jgi:DNA-binding MarR family transcriptional regulator
MDQELFAIQLQRHLSELVKAYELCDQGCVAQSGVTAAQGYTLLSLPETDYLPMNQLSDTMHVATSTMTRMIDQLVQKGLVCRQSDQEDRRVVLVGLTEQGREVQSSLEQTLHDFFSQVAAHVEENQRGLMLHTLEQITELVTALATNHCCGKR